MPSDPNSPLLLIRADATPQTGSGHVMRCIALADAWRHKGGEACFIGDIHGENLRNRITAEGFRLIPMRSPRPKPEDASETETILNSLRKKPSWIILDGYHFTPDYHRALKRKGSRLLVIDDMVHLDAYHTDILLNPNIYAEKRDYLCAPAPMFLMGSQYALIRNEFCSRRQRKDVPEKAENILITMGGADPDNVTLKVIKALKALKRKNLKIRIIIGPVNPNREIIEKEVLESDKIELLYNVTDMPSIMNWADMAVTAGGGTCGELAFLGIPFIIITLAENQVRNSDSLAGKGIGLNLGRFDNISDEMLSYRIIELINDRTKRKMYSENGCRFFDGKGAERTVEAMMQLPPETCSEQNTQ